jgi:antitoxin (DNA-binding transcriptional repressor) of toxin-antitoxin stability system
MQVVGVEEFRQNLGYFLHRASRGERYLVARHGHVEALVRPVRTGDRFPPIGAAALRSQAFRLIADAPRRPHVVTVHARRTAVVIGPDPADLPARPEA